jgi:hypothetical protein
MKSLLIQANGNNIRLGKYFKQPKYELYYNNERIINTIINNAFKCVDKVFVAVRKDFEIKFDTSKVSIILCEQTTSRLDTLKQCIPYLKGFESTIIHDCDTIIESYVLNKLENNSLAITNYKSDGLKYGFVELDQNFKYVKGNEKEMETGHITIGAYSVNNKSFCEYLENANEESLLVYYNQIKNVNVIYSKNHTNLGDIKSYIDNLWLL